MKNQEKSLKCLARLAKKRLKSQEELPIINKTVVQTEEEKLIAEKIFELLKTDYDTPTPLKELIDQNKFEKLSPLEKEIYIFNLIDKYNFYRDWYDKSKKEESLIV